MKSSNTPYYYGWLVLVGSALTEILAIGMTSFAAGLFVLPLQAEFHISRAKANSSLIILYVGAAFMLPFVGRMLDRYSVRLVVFFGAISLSASFMIIAITSSLSLMGFMLLLPAAFGFSALGPLKSQALVARWFLRRRGLALGLAAGLAGGGGVIVVPVLSQGIQQYGWRPTLSYAGIFLLVVCLLIVQLVLRDKPSDQGLEHQSENRSSATLPPEKGVSEVRWKDVFSTSAFWIPSLTLATITGASQAAVITLIPYGVQLGFKPISAAAFISAFALASGAMKVTAGLLADHLNQRLLLTAATVFMALCWLLLDISKVYGVVLLASSLAGMALGCALPTTASLVAGSFGPARFGRIMGWTYALNLLFSIAGVLSMGIIYDQYGSYRQAFGLFFLLTICLLIATLSFSRRSELALNDAHVQ